MLQPEQHHQWLHTSFVINNQKAKSDAIPSTNGSNLRGRRIWCKRPVLDTETQAQLCPSDTGGTIAFQDQMDDMVVRWDNGQITMHHKDALLRLAFLIGLHKTLKDHCECLASRCRCAG